jgi:hypothetical protein
VDGPASADFSMVQDETFEATLLVGGKGVRALVVDAARFSWDLGRFVDAADAVPDRSSVPIAIQRSGSYRLLQSDDLRSWRPALEGYYPEGIHRIRIEAEGPTSRFYQLAPSATPVW